MTIGMAAAAGATTAMTIDFLRARLLSERSVSRAAKERADQLARRVAELEEKLRTVTAQRRKAERAAAEVLAILDSQGFGRLSDAADDSGSDDEVDDGGHDAAERDRGCGGIARWEAPEDALSGSELGSQEAAAAQAGGLSWKGRVANPDWERRRPHHQQQKGRQLRQRHGHSHRRGYLYMRSTDSSPKYHPGQSCRKVKRKELRSQTEGRDGKEDIAGESTEEGQERSDCTVCTDERHDFDGEVSQDGRSSSSNARVEDGGSQCAMDYGKEGEMERVLEKQAQLIGQYEAQENAQREWEKKFSESQDSTVNSLNNNRNQTKNACGTRETAQIMDKEVVCEQAISSENNLFGINDPSKYLLTDSVSELPSNAAEYSAIEQCKTDDNHDFGKTTGTVASSDSELPVRKDVLVIKRFLEIVEGSGYNLGKSSPTPQGSCDSSLNDGHNKGQGDENSDSGSSYHADARSSEHYINAPSVGSPLCGTPKSEVSEWSSSCFHNHTDNQLDTQLHQPSNDDVGGVIEALQRAKMSLREKLSRPSPHSQNILALPAPEDRYTKYDCPVNDTQLSLSRSTHLSQEIQALPAPGDYLNRRILPRDYVNVPVGPACLFRLPTDSFPRNEMASSDGYGSRFSLTATRRLHISSGYPGNHIVSTPSFSHYGSGFSSGTYYDPHSSMLLPMPTAGECSIPVSDFRI